MCARFGASVSASGYFFPDAASARAYVPVGSLTPNGVCASSSYGNKSHFTGIIYCSALLVACCASRQAVLSLFRASKHTLFASDCDRHQQKIERDHHHLLILEIVFPYRVDDLLVVVSPIEFPITELTYR